MANTLITLNWIALDLAYQLMNIHGAIPSEVTVACGDDIGRMTCGRGNGRRFLFYFGPHRWWLKLNVEDVWYILAIFIAKGLVTEIR